MITAFVISLKFNRTLLVLNIKLITPKKFYKITARQNKEYLNDNFKNAAKIKTKACRENTASFGGFGGYLQEFELA